MSRDEKDGKEDKRTRNHTGSVEPEDPALLEWLNRLWARNEPPERIEVWQTFGRNKAIRGEMIHHEDFRHGEKLDIEQVNRMANEIVEAAQNDCDSARRESWYQIAITDRNRKASPLIRRLGPLQPKRAYAVAKVGDENGENDEEVMDARSIDLKYVQEGLAQARWDKTRYDRVMGEMLILQDNIIKNQQNVIDRFFNQQVSLFEKMQEAEDRRLDRDIIREKEKFKIDLWKDGMRTAANLLPGLFKSATDANKSPRLEVDEKQPSTDSESKDYGPSQERTLVDNFLSYCDDDDISIKMFGDFEEREGKLVQVAPGIFTVQQYAVMLGVRDGRYPVDTLDQLMPDSGHQNAIKQEQVEQAAKSGMTNGIGLAILELLALRQQARQQKQTEKKEDE